MHLTSWWPFWRYNTKEYVISSIVGSSRRGWLTLSATSGEIDCKPRIVYMVIQVHSYQLFDFVQSVHYIMPANDKIMSYAHKLCIQTGAMMAFKTKDLTMSCLLLLSYSIWKNNFTEAVVQHIFDSLLLLR